MMTRRNFIVGAAAAIAVAPIVRKAVASQKPKVARLNPAWVNAPYEMGLVSTDDLRMICPYEVRYDETFEPIPKFVVSP